MTGPPPGIAATRLAVRPVLADLGAGSRVVVAVSGGADSLALAAAVADEAGAAGVVAVGVVVDHGLQAGSAAVAEEAAGSCGAVGLSRVEVVPVSVAASGSGPEADARAVRYAALDAAAERVGATVVLVGHTLDDQAEQVLLGLLRGSGSRSLSGMPPRRGRYARPFLALRRAETRAACRERGLTWWEDPHNADPAYARVRVRELLAQVSATLGEDVAPALARTAALLRVDADHLDAAAAAARADLGASALAAAALAAVPQALRTRVWRLLAVEAGVPAGALTAAHVAALDALVTSWRGQGPVWLPGGVAVARSAGPDGSVVFLPPAAGVSPGPDVASGS